MNEKRLVRAAWDSVSGQRSPARSLQACGAGVTLMMFMACGSASSPTIEPVPQTAPAVAQDEIVALLPEALLSDSAADEAALAEMRELEFGSLAKGGVRGVVTPFTEDYPESSFLVGGPSHGGQAAVSGLSLDVETYLGHRRVQFYREYFTGKARERFSIWLGRMSQYEGMVLQHFRLHGLPPDLIYLGLVESGYSNTAVSRARAVGMWQFMASTGRRYGLRIDDWVDDRRDPFKATDAAARHLADLRDQFGSWYLAAAAYNAGAGRVSRGLRRLKTDATDEAYFALSDRRYIRRETRDYVPKLIAITVIARNPEQYGFGDAPKLEPLIYDEITVPSQTGLDVIATLADTTVRSITELNPAFFRGATPPRERAVVRVPRGKGTEVTRRYSELPVEERLNFVEHRIQRGQTLGHLAKRYRVSLRHLMAANPGVRPKRLRVGQRITVPVSPSAQASSVARPTRSTASRRTVPRPENGLHRIRRGDSLWEIARRYGVTVRDLRRWNRIPENVTLLSVGEQLRVAPR